VRGSRRGKKSPTLSSNDSTIQKAEKFQPLFLQKSKNMLSSIKTERKKGKNL